MRRREVTRERLGDAGDADPDDEQADRVARTCWAIERRLRKVDEALDRLSFSGLKIWPPPSSFRCLLEEVEDDPAENAPSEGLFTACDKALRGFEQAAEQAIGRIRAIAEARREVAPGDWNDAALGRIRHVLRRIEEARKVLDDDSLPSDEFETVREGSSSSDGSSRRGRRSLRCCWVSSASRRQLRPSTTRISTWWVGRSISATAQEALGKTLELGGDSGATGVGRGHRGPAAV